MEIKGFSFYDIEPDGTVYSTKSGKRKPMGGGKRDCTIRMRSDDGNVFVGKMAKVLWCAKHGINPLDFPKGDFIVSKEYGIISKADLMSRNNEKVYKKWKKEDAIAELDRCRRDNELQLLFHTTGNMSPLLLRFEEYRTEICCMLVHQFGMNKDTAQMVIECVQDSFIKNVSANFPIHSVKAYMVGAAKRYMKAYRRNKRQVVL